VDLELFDCAGWLVDQWHEQDWVMGSVPSEEQLVSLSLAALARVQAWMRDEPVAAESLMTRGLAYDPRKGPTYWYTLFKTTDGQMRAYVRPGGPAYAAGMRTNDIVVRLDGKFWWEYGTFQTQGRAYDGLPHTFEVMREGKKLDVQLGAPYGG
jgi:predicted metalloprotease with PDZ domain